MKLTINFAKRGHLPLPPRFLNNFTFWQFPIARAQRFFPPAREKTLPPMKPVFVFFFEYDFFEALFPQLQRFPH